MVRLDVRQPRMGAQRQDDQGEPAYQPSPELHEHPPDQPRRGSLAQVSAAPMTGIYCDTISVNNCDIGASTRGTMGPFTHCFASQGDVLLESACGSPSELRPLRVMRFSVEARLVYRFAAP